MLWERTNTVLRTLVLRKVLNQILSPAGETGFMYGGTFGYLDRASASPRDCFLCFGTAARSHTFAGRWLRGGLVRLKPSSPVITRVAWEW